MGKFFSRFKTEKTDPAVSAWSSLSTVYGLLVFLIAIPFILIVALVWLTGILGFSAWIFAAFAGVCVWVGWRLYRGWGKFKGRVASQGSDLHDLMREAAQNDKDMEISLLNGVVTLRYRGRDLNGALPGRAQALVLEAPSALAADEAPLVFPPERLREELEEFIRLRDQGEISPEEFDRIKAGLLKRMSA